MQDGGQHDVPQSFNRDAVEKIGGKVEGEIGLELDQFLLELLAIHPLDPRNHLLKIRQLSWHSFNFEESGEAGPAPPYRPGPTTPIGR